MKKSEILLVIILSLFTVHAYSDSSMKVIKVTGNYGIINKGKNHGVVQGQIFIVKRLTRAGMRDLGKVKVVRVTANRAAVEHIEKETGDGLRILDRLFGKTEVLLNPVAKSPRERREPPAPVVGKTIEAVENKPVPVAPEGEMASSEEIGTSDPTYSNSRKPWIGFNLGATFPHGEFASSYSPSAKFGASYMVPTGRHFNIGVEVNKTFVNGSNFGSGNLSGFSTGSSSLLEAHLVFEKFLGNYFFFESGGGIYRPKVTAVSFDNEIASYSSTKFGVFAGSGFYIPTSTHAGFTLKGRVHNYFDDSASKQFFGLVAGFRFKVK